ncbi:MAG: hypothetical protein U0P81_00510 [Holophagaceae bacterium]
MRLAALLPAVPVVLAAQATSSSVAAFRFDRARVAVGRTLHYTKSNRDGSKPIEVVIHLEDADTVDAYKIENRGRWLAHVRATMDWATFTVRASRSWNQLESGEPNLQAELALDAKAGTYTARFGPYAAPATVGHLPLVVYNFDFTGANVIWPFRTDPKADLELGVADPDFTAMASLPKAPGAYPQAFPYRGKAIFSFAGEAEHRGVPCWKYRVGGPAFGDAEGTLLVNKAQGYWELFEHPKADNPAWKDFKFELEKVETLSLAQWQAYTDGLVKAAMGPEDLGAFQAPDLPQPLLLAKGLEAAGDNDYRMSIPCLRAFLARNPFHGEAWSALGDGLWDAKHYAESAAAYGKAAELGWQPSLSRYWAAQGLVKAGRNEEALESLRQAMALGFENPPRALRDKALKPLWSDPRFRSLMGAAPEGLPDRDARWRHDLAWLVSELKRKHVHLFAKVTPGRFEAERARLEKDIPALDDATLAVRIAEFLALVGDGHTALFIPVPGQFPFSLGMPLPALKLAPLPLRFYVFPDGPRVVAATKDQQRLLGAKVLAVGGVPAEEALARLASSISRENSQWVKERLPDRLQVPAILQATGLAASAVEATLTLEVDGTREEVRLQALPVDAQPAWVEAQAPALRRHADRAYWSEHLAAANTTVVRYNAARREAEAPAAFWKRVIAEAEAKKVSRFVVDLRANSGGDNGLNKPMVEGLRASAWLNAPGRLYVLVGRATFSAGMNAAADLARETKATFVGEPTGSSPNFAGEASPVTLPCSGLQAIVSSRYFQGSDPTDRSLWIAPALLVEPAYQDWTSGRDAALEAVLALPLP